jgi:hypothetical protein
MVSKKRREYLKKWCLKQGDRLKQYKLDWARNRSPEMKEAARARARFRSKRDRKKLVQKQRECRERYRDKVYARYKIMYAVRCKRIIVPEQCEHCGTKTKLHGHHPDYSKPLEVIWVCPPCHGKIHCINALMPRGCKDTASNKPVMLTTLRPVKRSPKTC